MKEETIIAQIETVNDMLYVICKELNELETIYDYEIELNETEYETCINKKVERNYEIIVTCKKNLESKGR